MKLTVDRKLFRDQLALCSRAVNKSMTIPVLRLTLMQAEGSRLTLTNSDLEFSVNLSLDANVQAPGSLCIDTERLLRYADNSSGETISMEVKGGLVNVSCGGGRARIPFSDPGAFPVIPKPSGEWHSISAPALTSLLDKTVFCISDNGARFSVQAVLLAAEGDGWQAVATDGHRMSASLYRAENGRPFKCLLPKRLCSELIRCLPNDGPALLSLDDNNIFVRFQDVEITHRRMSASFPDWRRCIPGQATVTVDIETATLLQALNCAAPFIEQTKAEGYKVGLSLSTGEAQIDAEGQGGSAEYLIPVKYGGLPYKIYFNAHYLRDPLKVCGETVSISASEPLRPFTVVSKSDADTVHVIFPQKK